DANYKHKNELNEIFILLYILYYALTSLASFLFDLTKNFFNLVNIEMTNRISKLYAFTCNAIHLSQVYYRAQMEVAFQLL
ncbi:hypothetical protein ALC60_00387, partial [Trachymyrmex zeteki]